VSILQISKDLFDLFKELKDNVIALDTELNVTHANNSSNLLFGIEPERLVGRNLFAIKPRVAGNIFNKEILETIARKEIVSKKWEDAINSNLWQTTIFPADDGLAMISKRVPVFI
jgi:transcriptional regulator with PAS, ATPase and Fis domain